MAKKWQEAYEKWRNFNNLDPKLHTALDKIKDDPERLEDAFYQELAFGTGGIRGIMGPGTNRMNLYTVRKAVNGLANYLLKQVVNPKHRGVVLAYDSRHMSKEFAVEAARVLGVYGIRASVFSSMRPTPVLSFAVRYLGAAAGIMITASHNPPEYNGLKVYNEDGGQILLDEAEQITKEIAAIEDELTVPVGDIKALEEELQLNWVGEEVDKAYLERLEQVSKLSEAEKQQEKDLKIVYTPLHGTGTDLVKQGLSQLNFPHLTLVKEQVVADPEFSTVTSPNPEEHQAFTLAIRDGEKVDADILLATDPDADRLGMAVKDSDGEYIVLTGNQLGSLFLDYILSQSDLNVYRNARLIKTVVTTELGRAIADSYGVETIETLTGFKYIAEKINQFTSTGETFMFGYEESYGYLASSFTRDKDAIQAAVLSAEMAYYWKNQGKTVLEALESLYEKHGFYLEGLTSLKLEGKEGSEKIARIMEEIRSNPMKEIAGLMVETIENYITSERQDVQTGEIEEITLPKENMMKFLLQEDTWVTFRPSGTEPKIKYYYGVRGNSKEDSMEKLESVEQALEEIVATILESV
jgi:phosphoglucomutase